MLGYSICYLQFYEVSKSQNETPQTQNSISPQTPYLSVIASNTGKKVLPIDQSIQPALDIIAECAETLLAEMNAPDSPAKGHARINEVSRLFENSLQKKLNIHPDFACEFPQTIKGKTQRSGFPDLVIRYRPNNRYIYLDPKLYEETSQDSTLRTFYYTPRKETSKILENAHHLLLGFAHDGKDGDWTFTNWHLLDLSKLTLNYKGEYNASNRDLYQAEHLIRSRSESL